MSTEHEPQFKSNIIAVMADPTNPMHQPALTPGELVKASEVVKAGVKAYQQLDENYARLTQATAETQRLAARYAHGYQED